MFGSALCWIRRDLRLVDHRALAEATQAAERVAVVFVFDKVILDALQDRDDRRISFLFDSLSELDAELRRLGSALIVQHGDPVEEILRLAEELKVEAVFWNADAEPYALKRDAEVHRRLVQAGVAAKHYKDHVIFTAREVRNQSGGPFRVFTPYSKAWRARLTEPDVQDFSPNPERFWRDLPVTVQMPTLNDLGFERSDPWLEPGPRAAQERLNRFQDHIDGYGQNRDRVDLGSTSGLSVHLRHGTISIRACVRAAQAHATTGAEKWLSELIWRDFYHMILEEFPQVVERPFRSEYQQLKWPGKPAHFEAWCIGQTGYPIVDAGMRCLRATGWMHNRLRMITAMFLTKDLLIDYRLGEAHFARWLLDFDLASNNGGWQWSSSMGADAQPYFRIFNPVLQSAKTDPDGEFIRQWCPELAGFAGDQIHWPHGASLMEQQIAGCVLGADYPHPIVDHAVQRQLALALLERTDRNG